MAVYPFYSCQDIFIISFLFTPAGQIARSFQKGVLHLQMTYPRLNEKEFIKPSRDNQNC